MGANDDINITRCQTFACKLLIPCTDHARHLRDLDRQALEALTKGAVVLARQQRGRHNNRHLLAIDGGCKGSAQCHFRLAKAHITANQAIHGTARGQIIQGGLNGVLLIFRLIIREACAEFVIEMVSWHKTRRFAQHAFSGNLDERMRNLANALFHPRAA